jgi:ankyrin repeat protein
MTAGPSQQPRFLPLRPPPDIDSDSSAMYPRGTTAEQRQLLSGYASHGYSPTGVNLPEANAKGKRSADEMHGNGNNHERDFKKSRGNAANGSDINRQASGVFVSPVKDLNALGRITSPTSAWRGVREPTRLNRVSLGPPDALRLLQINGTRFADRPQTLHEGDEGEKRMRSRIMQMFERGKLEEKDAEEASETATSNDMVALENLLRELRHAASLAGHSSLTDIDMSASVDLSGPPPCVDLVIDEHGHTALHWSAALGKLANVRMLVAAPPASGGANVHAGNHAGETALQRAVLVSNSYDTSTFPILLQLLSSSLHTRDYRKRTVLHHIALVSALRGRGVTARYYMACVLDYIALHQGGRYTNLVDAQDEDGETALSIVARIGNASMVKMLLEVGARKDITNVLGLKASDWGIEGLDGDAEDTTAAVPATSQTEKNASDIVSSLTKPPKAPVQKSKDVLEQMTAVLSDLTDVSQREVADKDQAFTVAQAHLQSATRELALRRRRIAEGQARVADRDEARLRRANLSRALHEELQAGDDEDENTLVRRCLEYENENASDMEVDGIISEPIFEKGNGADSLVKMRWLQQWYTNSLDGLQNRIDDLHQSSKSKLDQCRKVVAMCCGVPENRVESMLDDLVAAIESIGVEGVDLQRLAGFLSKVKRNPEASPAH